MNVRTVVLVLGLFSVLSTAAGGYLYYHSVQESALRETEIELVATNEALRDDVVRLISFNQNEVKALAGFDQLQEALVDHQNKRALAQANRILDHFAEGLAYDVCFLIDSAGNCIASSNRNHQDSFVGVNYIFRKYFQDANQGRPCVELALGLVTRVRGIFFSYPVYPPDGSTPAGVVVIKVSTRDLDRVFLRARNMIALLANSDGMIFVSSRENWILNLLWRLSPEELARIGETKQFGRGPWNWTGLEKKADNQALDSSGADYTIRDISLENCPGWRIVSLYNYKTVSEKIHNPFTGKIGYIALILCLMVGGAVIVLYTIAQRDIRGREKSEEALRQSEFRLSRAELSAGFGNWEIDLSSERLTASNGARKIYGVAQQELTINDIREFPLPEYRSRLKKAFLALIKDGAPYDIEFQIKRANDNQVIDILSTAYYDPEKNSVFGIIHDITERNRVGEALRESERKYRMLFDTAPIGIILVDRNGKILEANHAILEMLGSPGPEATKSINMLTFPPLVEAGIPGLFRTCTEHGRPVDDYIFYTTKWGKQICMRVHITPKFGTDGDIEGCMAVVEDVMPRKLAEQAQEESEEKYRLLFENAPMGIVLVDKNGKILEVNEQLVKTMGSPSAEMTKQINVLTFQPMINAGISKHYRDCMTEGEKADFEVPYTTKWGKETYLRIVLTPVYTPDRQIAGSLGVYEDILERKMAEETQNLLSTAIEQAAEGVIITDATGTIQYVNPSQEILSGYSRDELLGQTPNIFKSDKYDDSFHGNMWASIAAGNVWHGKFINKKKDGTECHEDTTISPVYDKSGNLTNFVALKHDVTKQDALQEQLVQAQKMEAVGNLAGGIAHDFNNLLQVILGFSEVLLRERKEGDTDYSSRIQKIHDAGKRGADLVKGLMTFSRQSEPTLRPSDLNHEVLLVQDLLSRTIPKTVKIDLKLDEYLESIQADRSQVGQILMNLAVNARDAMPDGGTLTIETANIELDEEDPLSHLEMKPGRYVLLTVSDTGQGMDKETLKHVFEPFFTTKEVGKGTGLGLATVYGIVRQHSGHIVCHSEPGHGTTFKVFFPPIPTKKDSDAPKNEGPIPGGTETILLVEDDDVVRELCQELLNNFGYGVVSAANGKEALEIYQSEGEKISLVILDLIMPVMDGSQCLKEILRINPQAKVLIASGYSENEAETKRLLTRAKNFVSKPYDMSELLHSIRDILDND